MSLDFSVTDSETATFGVWALEHDKTCRYANPAKRGAIGGRYTFSFTGTTLGTIVKVQCACGANADLTDYDAF